PLDLHSFPTRRSSDLRWRSGSPDLCIQRLHTLSSRQTAVFLLLSSRQTAVYLLLSLRARTAVRAKQSPAFQPEPLLLLQMAVSRSEEHTSELQSRFDL